MTKCEHNYLPYYKKIVGWRNNDNVSRYDGEIVESLYCTKCLKVTTIEDNLINT